MPIEKTQDLLKHLDISIEGEELTEEAFDAAFQTKYIPKLKHDEYRNQMGGAFKAVDSQLLKTATQFLGADEVAKIKVLNDDGTPVRTSEIAKVVSEKIWEKHQTELKTASNPDGEKKLAEALAKAEQARKLAEEKDAENITLRQSLETKDLTYAQQLEQAELNRDKAHLYGSLNWSDQADDDFKAGFTARMDKTYKTERRDGKLAIFALNGDTVKDSKGLRVLSPEEVMDMELEKAGKKKLNNVKQNERFTTGKVDETILGKRKVRSTAATLAAARGE